MAPFRETLPDLFHPILPGASLPDNFTAPASRHGDREKMSLPLETIGSRSHLK
jgi:hypothetical protein